jgi:hypothetical protein
MSHHINKPTLNLRMSSDVAKIYKLNGLRGFYYGICPLMFEELISSDFMVSLLGNNNIGPSALLIL